MKISPYFGLLLLGLLFVLSCDENPVIPDTTPPTVSIQSPVSGETVSGTIIISVNSDDNQGISKVEFYINDELVFTDSVSVYEFSWNTLDYESGEYIIQVISYDLSNNTTVSQPILLTLNNTDITPPTVSIQSPNNGQIISGEVNITVITEDEGGINRVEFFINESLLYTDSESPYQFNWNTEDEIDGEYNLFVKSYDNSGNNSISNTINILVDNPLLSIDILSVSYDTEKMTISWGKSNESNFNSYILLNSNSEDGIKDTLVSIYEIETTIYEIEVFNPFVENWFWISVVDDSGDSIVGEGQSNEIEQPIENINLLSVNYNFDSGDIDIEWEEYEDFDLESYNITHYYYSSFGNYNFEESEDITLQNTDQISHSFSDIEVYSEHSFTISVTDYWGQQSIESERVYVGENEYHIRDIEGLKSIISEYTSLSSNLDSNGNGTIEPTEFGTQGWSSGNLQSINCFYCNLNGEFSSSFSYLTQIEQLMFYSCGISGSIPESIGELTNLEILFFDENNITGSIPSSIDNLVNLKKFSFSQNSLSGSIPYEIGELSNLEEMNLGYNYLTGEIPESISELLNLKLLNLSYNFGLSGGIPEGIGSLVNLEDLYLRDITMYDENIPVSLCNLINLKNLDLSGNYLTGHIPNEIGNLISLERLYLEINNLSGSIPESIGDLTNLEVLKLYDNQLSGSIPSSIGDLTNLQILLLESNQLTGQIPDDICNTNIDWDYYTLNPYDPTGYQLFTIQNNFLCPPFPDCIPIFLIDHGQECGD